MESILNFCHYCLNDELLVDFIDFFEERGIGVINASPLSMGLLSERGAPDWHPAPEALKAACTRAAEYCKEKGYPIEKLAVQYSTSLNPRIATALFSSANPQNVLKNIQFVNEPMDEELVKEVKAIIGVSPPFHPTLHDFTQKKHFKSTKGFDNFDNLLDNIDIIIALLQIIRYIC